MPTDLEKHVARLSLFSYMLPFHLHVVPVSTSTFLPKKSKISAQIQEALILTELEVKRQEGEQHRPFRSSVFVPHSLDRYQTVAEA